MIIEIRKLKFNIKISKMDTCIASIDAISDSKGMTPQTCRAARSLVGISQAELAQSAGVTPLTVRKYEAGKTVPSLKTWRAMKTVLERAGVVFIDEGDGMGPGVRLREGKG